MNESVLDTAGVDASLNPSTFSQLGDVDTGTSGGFSTPFEAVNKDLLNQSFVLKKGYGKRISKCVRKMDKPLLLVVGEDVPLNKIVLTNALTLVGRFGGRNFSPDGLHRWVSDSWTREISLCPKIFILPRGWLAFKFQFPADADVILKGV